MISILQKFPGILFMFLKWWIISQKLSDKYFIHFFQIMGILKKIPYKYFIHSFFQLMSILQKIPGQMFF